MLVKWLSTIRHADTILVMERGSIVDALVRGSGDIDIHVVSGEPGQRGATQNRWGSPQ